MGCKTDEKILSNDADSITNLHKCIYCDEMMRIFRYFWYSCISLEGIGIVTCAAAPKTRAKGALSITELLADRIAKLEDTMSSDQAESANYNTTGPLDPAKLLTVGIALDRALKFEGKGVWSYRSIAKHMISLGNYVPDNLATTILAEEAEDEQQTQVLEVGGGSIWRSTSQT